MGYTGGYAIPGLPSSLKNATGMARGSAMCAIGMVKGSVPPPNEFP